MNFFIREDNYCLEFQKETPRQEGVVQEADKPSSSTTEESVKEADNTQEVEVQKDGGEKMETWEIAVCRGWEKSRAATCWTEETVWSVTLG